MDTLPYLCKIRSMYVYVEIIPIFFNKGGQRIYFQGGDIWSVMNFEDTPLSEKVGIRFLMHDIEDIY